MKINRKFCYSLVIGFILSYKLNAQHITFDRNYSGSGGFETQSKTIIQTPDSGFLVSADYDLTLEIIFKLDKFGYLQWLNKCYPSGPLFSAGTSFNIRKIYYRSPNRYEVTGSTYWSDVWGNINMRLIYSIDSSGNFLGGNATSPIEDVRIADTLNNGYIAVGTFLGDIRLSRLDSTGSAIWRREYSNPASEYPEEVIHTKDNGYLISGIGQYNNFHVLLIKTDSTGAIQWHRQFYTSNIDYRTVGALEANDKSLYVLAGINTGNTMDDFIIIKLDSSGNIIYIRKYITPNNSFVDAFCFSNDSALLVGALNEGALIKLDLNGNVLWAKNYIVSAMTPTVDGGVAVVTTYNDTIAPINDITVIKTDPSGNSCNPVSDLSITDSMITLSDYSTTFISAFNSTDSSSSFSLVNISSAGEETNCMYNDIDTRENPKEPIEVYPNPFENVVNVRLATDDKVEIIFYDITSRKIFEQIFNNTILIHTEQLHHGIYFYQVRRHNKVIGKGKLLKY